jgi:hypothetical protein
MLIGGDAMRNPFAARITPRAVDNRDHPLAALI